MNLQRIIACAAALLFMYSPLSRAEEHYKPGQVISDGKSGRVWSQWIQTVNEKHINQIVVYMVKTSGGDDTYVNLRFGKDGQTLDGGKRVHLKDNKEHKEIWQVNRAPQGQPLVLNAYNGEVKIKSVWLKR